MAARWQQWMPFHIDRFRGSPDVQAMHPAARCGFLYLLAAAWQTDDCSIPSDPLDLATVSGLGDELWALYGPRIVRKFESVDGRLVNRVLLAEWRDAKSVYDKRKSGALRTNESRSADAERTQSQRNADTVTETGTLHKQSTEPKTLALTAVALPAGEVFLTVPLNVGSEFPIDEAKVSEWISLYPGIDVRQQLRSYKAWAINNPTRRKTRAGICKSINSWLAKAQNESRPPRGENNHGTHTTAVIGPASIRERQSNDEIDRAVQFHRNLRRTGFADEADEGDLSRAGNY
jgi:hypothetical protein